jgi:hypothetical protein
VLARSIPIGPGCFFKKYINRIHNRKPATHNGCVWLRSVGCAGNNNKILLTSNQSNIKIKIMKKVDLQLVIEYVIIFAMLVALAAIKVFI